MKKFAEIFKELRKGSRGKALLFFCFYFLFFLILILFIRSSRNYSSHKYEYESGKKNIVSLNELLKRNYSFSYSILLDDNEYLYEGSKNGKKEIFLFQDKNYYVENGEYFVKEDNWNKSESPYYFSDFLNEEKIDKMLTASSFISKTSYESGKITYNYLLSSNTINLLLNGIDSDFFEEPNKITVDVNETGVLEEIHFYLDSYCFLNELCSKSLDIRLSYSNFGKVSNIEKTYS